MARGEARPSILCLFPPGCIQSDVRAELKYHARGQLDDSYVVTTRHTIVAVPSNGPAPFSAPAPKRGASEGDILTKNSCVENLPAQATGDVTQGLRTAPTEPPFSEAFS